MFPRGRIGNQCFAQTCPTSIDARLDRADGGVGNGCDFLVRVALDIGEHNRDSLIVGQLTKGALQQSAQFLAGCVLLRMLGNFGLAGPVRLGLDLLGIERSGRAAAAGPKQIEAAVCRDLEKPRPDQTTPERVDGGPRLEEGVLGGILGEGGVAQGAEANVVNGAFVTCNEGIERREVALPGILDQPFIEPILSIGILIVERHGESRSYATNDQ